MNEYARHEHHDFLNAAGQALQDPPLQAALVRLTDTLLAGNRRGYAALADSGPLLDHAKRIKEHTLAHLDRYLEQLEASVHKLGGHVHWAATAEDARRIVCDIARRAGCKRAVKSKSMTSEEVHLNLACRSFCRLGLDANAAERRRLQGRADAPSPPAPRRSRSAARRTRPRGGRAQ